MVAIRIVLFVLEAILLKLVDSNHQGRKYNDYYLDDELQEISKELADFQDSKENLERHRNFAKSAEHLGRRFDTNDKTDSKYEITENVIDVPNNLTVTGPIIVNYTITKPLNALGNNTTDSINFNGQTNKEKAIINPKKQSFSIFHVKAEFEDNKPNHPNIDLNEPTQVYNFNDVNNHIREYLDGIRKGLAKGINSLVNTNRLYDTNRGIYLPDNRAKYVQTLQKKGSDAVREFHDVVFG